MKYVRLLMVFCCVIFVHPLFSQKKTLDTTAFSQWKRLGNPSISYDGKWVLYNYTEATSPVKYLVNTQTGKEILLHNVKNVNFFNYGKWLRYTVSANSEDSIIFLCLKDGRKIYWDKQAFINQSAASANLIYSNGTHLVVWNIDTGDSTIVEQAGKYTLYNNEHSIIYVKDHQLLAGPLKGKQKIVYAGPVKDYSFNADRTTGTFVSDSTLYAFSVKTGLTKRLFSFKDIVAPAGYKVVMKAYDITEKTKQIQLEMIASDMPAPRKVVKPATPGFELELWTWNERVSQRRQRKGVYNKIPLDNAKFIYNIDDNKCVQIAAEGPQRIIVPPSDQYDHVLLSDPVPYAGQEDWLYANNVDLYLINVHTGERTLVARNCYNFPQWSPGGKYAVIYDGVKKEWQVMHPATGTFENCSGQIGYPVHEEDYDMPKPAPAYGLAGWADGGSSMVVYDRYDLWVIDLTGKKKAYALTNGRQHQVSFRLLSAPYNEHLDITQPLLFRSFNERTKSTGVYRLSANKRTAQLNDIPDYSTKVSAIAGDGKSCVFTRQSYSTYPDLWWGDMNFRVQKRLTNVNPQQQEYNWGSVKVVQWINNEGRENEGLLYLPEHYDATKRYPMIVDFYETHAENLHEYIVPEYSTCTINIPAYVSSGYVVFRPDVHFTIGKPGQSAYNAVVSGTMAMIERGVADKERIGLQGHSWSGYQVGYLVTKTNIFKCATPEAPVVNMTYNYSAIRANGAPCQFMYETGQSRIGANLWENQQAYLENSTIFNADKIQTPLLIFHNDKDGAVAFTQGLDLFLAMRRLRKPAWLLNYKGEGHTLDGLEAKKDWTFRMRQFFDHYLMDKSAPRWMKEGISIDERNVDQKYDY
jgi:dipeptidyl aminopeptidase/acylaminoacyl peptidase